MIAEYSVTFFVFSEKMQPIAIQRCVSVCECVCLYVMGMNPAKTAESTEMLFGMWARVGLQNDVLDEGPDPCREGAILVVDIYGHVHSRYLSRCHLACGLGWTQITMYQMGGPDPPR